MARDSVLVTGASGFLGRIICQELSTDFTIDTLSKSPANKHAVDLAVEIPAFEKQYHMIIHAAGKAHVIPKTEKEAREFFQTNYEGTVNLINGIEQSGKLPEEFVFISSVAVYGLEKGEMITEDFPLLGETPYAKSKIQAELFLQEWCKKNNIKLSILRLPLLIGQNPAGNLGAMVSWMKAGFYVGIGSGSARKSMVLATDVARYIPAVAKLGGTYHLSDGYHPTLLEFENAIAKNVNRNKPYRLPDAFLHLAARAGDRLGDHFPLNSQKFDKLVTSLTFSDEKAKAIAGWKPRSVIDNLPSLV